MEIEAFLLHSTVSSLLRNVGKASEHQLWSQTVSGASQLCHSLNLDKLSSPSVTKSQFPHPSEG